jgi:hypothetical protein
VGVGVGDAGPDDVVVLCGEPPHCDIKDSTVKERTERSISKVHFWQAVDGTCCFVKQHRARMRLFTSFGASHGDCSFLSKRGGSS